MAPPPWLVTDDLFPVPICAIGIPRRVAVQGLDEGLTPSCSMFLRTYLKFLIGKNGRTIHHGSMGLGQTCCRVRSRLFYHTETEINASGFLYSRVSKTSTTHFYKRYTTNMGLCPATSTFHILTQMGCKIMMKGPRRQF